MMRVQAQFLDRDHLLVALGHPDTVMARNMDVAPGLVFFVIYDMAISTVRKVTSNNADGMMMAYMRHASMFHAADIRNDWERYITPALVGLHPPYQQERVITRQWGYPVVSHLLIMVLAAESKTRKVCIVWRDSFEVLAMAIFVLV